MAIDASAFGYRNWTYELDGYSFRIGEADRSRAPYNAEYWVEASLSDNCPITVLEAIESALELYNSGENYAQLPIKEFLDKVCRAGTAGGCP